MFLGLSIPIIKILLGEWLTPSGYMMLRSAGVLVLFLVVQCFMPREKIALRDLGIIALGSFLGFVVAQYAAAISLQYTTPVYFSMTYFMSPIVTMFLAALLLHESISLRKTGGVILSIAGAAVLLINAPTNTSGQNHLLGVSLAFFSLINTSLFIISMRSVAAKYNPIVQTKWLFFFAFIFISPVGFNQISEQKLLSSAWEWSGVLCMLYIIVLATFASYTLMPFAMRKLNATTVSVYFNVQPLVASLAAIAIGQDTFKIEQPIAAIFVLIGAYIVSTARQANMQESSSKEAHSPKEDSSPKMDSSYQDELAHKEDSSYQEKSANKEEYSHQG